MLRVTKDNIPHTYKSDTEKPGRSTRARTQTGKKNLEKSEDTINVAVMRCRVLMLLCCGVVY